MFRNGFKLACGAYVGWQVMSALDEITTKVLAANREKIVQTSADALSKLIFGKK